MSKYGLIYIVSNSEQKKNLFKIGKTSRSIDERIKELNSATGTLGKFQAHATFLVDDIDETEKFIHKKLKNLRYQSNREFFSSNYTELLVKVQDLIGKNCFKENLITQPDKKILVKINYKRKKQDMEFLEKDIDMDKILKETVTKTSTEIKNKEIKHDQHEKNTRRFVKHQKRIFLENVNKLKKTIKKYKFIIPFLISNDDELKFKIIISQNNNTIIEKIKKHHLKFFKPHKQEWGGVIVDFKTYHGAVHVGRLEPYYNMEDRYEHKKMGRDPIYNLPKVFKYLVQDLARLIINHKKIDITENDYSRSKRFLIDNSLSSYSRPYENEYTEDNEEDGFNHNDCDFEYALNLYLKFNKD